ncbi:hypothetical protein K438DRAFT_1982673 [Mycena galopus ATCC 62051]|nr:hypothetical protein K438DRAFT_1982673 [Mycena galopus ATCC 62051]
MPALTTESDIPNVDMGPPELPPLVEDNVDTLLSSGIILPRAPAAPPALAGSAMLASPVLALPVPTPVAPAPSTSAHAPAKPMWGIALINNDMRAKIESMEPVEREEYKRQLRRMTPFYSECENNIVRNQRITVDMALMGAAKFFGTKRKRMGTPKERKRKKGDEEDWDDNSDNSECEDEEESGEEAERISVKTQAQAAPPSMGVTASDGAAGGGGRNAPAWVKSGLKSLNAGVMRSDWKRLVGLWYALEEQNSYATGTKAHPTTNWPKAVAAWVKNAHKTDPQIGDVENEKPVQAGEGDWDVLRYPGQNGFLNVLMCLKSWFTAIKTPLEAWNEVVADVTWALTKILGKDPAPAPAAEPAPAPAEPVPAPTVPGDPAPGDPAPAPEPEPVPATPGEPAPTPSEPAPTADANPRAKEARRP